MGERTIAICFFCHQPVTTGQAVIECDTFRRISTGNLLHWKAHDGCALSHWEMAALTQDPRMRRIGRRIYRLKAAKGGREFKRGCQSIGRGR